MRRNRSNTTLYNLHNIFFKLIDSMILYYSTTVRSTNFGVSELLFNGTSIFRPIAVNSSTSIRAITGIPRTFCNLLLIIINNWVPIFLFTKLILPPTAHKQAVPPTFASSLLSPPESKYCCACTYITHVRCTYSFINHYTYIEMYRLVQCT